MRLIIGLLLAAACFGQTKLGPSPFPGVSSEGGNGLKVKGALKVQKKSTFADDATFSGNVAINATLPAALAAAGCKGVWAANTQIVTPQMCGATGAGAAADDTTAIQAAVTAAQTAGAKLHFPAAAGGYYKITSPITISAALELDGEAGAEVRNATAKSHVFVIQSASHVRVRGLTLTAAGTYPDDERQGTPVAIYSDTAGSEGVTVENCVLKGGSSAGVAVEPNASTYTARHVVIRNNRFLNPATTTGLTTQPSLADVAVQGRSDDVLIQGNDMQGANDFGVAILGLNSGGGVSPISNVRVIGNTIRNKNRYGVMAYQSTSSNTITNLQVAGNVIENISSRDIGQGNEYGMGIYLQTVTGALIADNTLRNCVQGYTGSQLPPGSIALNYGGAGPFGALTIARNHIYTSSQYGIYALLQPPKGYADLSISDNVVVSPAQTGIMVRYFQGARIVGNVVDGAPGGIFAWTDADYAQIVANRVSGATSSGLRTNANVGALMTNNVVTGGATGVLIEGSASQAQVRENTVTGQSLNAINLSGSATDMTVTGNTLTAAALAGLYSDATVRNLVHGRNYFAGNGVDFNIDPATTFGTDTINSVSNLKVFPDASVGIGQAVSNGVDKLTVGGHIGTTGSVLLRAGTPQFVGSVAAVDVRFGSNSTDRWILYGNGQVGFGSVPPVYANNAAAVAGGLALGMIYRTGADPDVLCVVH